jgi:hypothetical protein
MLKGSLVHPGIIWIATIYILSHVREWRNPQLCTALESVSGFYGPGAYWAWVLTMVSATIQSLSGDDNKRISNDFIAACIYTLVAMGDAQLRMCSDCDLKSDFQAQAALHVTWATFICCIIIVPLIQWVCQKNNQRKVDTLNGPWRFRSWTAFMIVAIVQISSTYPSKQGFIPMMVTHMGIAMMVAFFILPPSTITKPGPGAVLYICCHSIYGKYLPMERIPLPIFAPRTGSSIMDMDQMIGLGTAILFLVLQWKPWRLILRFLPWLRRDEPEQPPRRHRIYPKGNWIPIYPNNEENNQLEEKE